jgi:hypothetical protein
MPKPQPDNLSPQEKDSAGPLVQQIMASMEVPANQESALRAALVRAAARITRTAKGFR